MSVLIKGMEMPANCFQCKLSYIRENRLFCYQTRDEVLRAKIADNCPLVQVPPHGRLIDADALQLKLLTAEPGKVYDFCYPCKEVLQAIKDSPTIIERETN